MGAAPEQPSDAAQVEAPGGGEGGSCGREGCSTARSGRCGAPKVCFDPGSTAVQAARGPQAARDP